MGPGAGALRPPKERRTAELPGLPVTSPCSLRPLWETEWGRGGQSLLTEIPFRNPSLSLPVPDLVPRPRVGGVWSDSCL